MTFALSSENRAGKPYFATTARRTDGDVGGIPDHRGRAAVGGGTVRDPAPDVARPQTSTRCVWARRLVLPVASTVMTANRAGSSSDGREPHGRRDRLARCGGTS